MSKVKVAPSILSADFARMGEAVRNPDKWNARNIKTWYYTTHLHLGAFMLPKYVEDILNEEENRG